MVGYLRKSTRKTAPLPEMDLLTAAINLALESLHELSIVGRLEDSYAKDPSRAPMRYVEPEENTPS